MNFIMTGHKGLIGSFLLKRLKSEGHTPLALIDTRSESPTDIRTLSQGIWRPPREVDVLFHLASFCKIRECVAQPHMAFEHNARGTYSVMQFCAKFNIPKIVFTSSTRVLYPEKNPYTASKLYGEELVKSYGLEYVIVRPSTVYGPFNDLTRRVTHEFIMSAIKGKDLIIYGDKNKTLDFTYVDDFVNAFMLASKETNKTFNVGTGRGSRLCDVAQLIINIVGSKSKVVYAEAEKLQPQNVVIDATDFDCPTTIEEGMKKNIHFLATYDSLYNLRYHD